MSASEYAYAYMAVRIGFMIWERILEDHAMPPYLRGAFAHRRSGERRRPYVVVATDRHANRTHQPA